MYKRKIMIVRLWDSESRESREGGALAGNVDVGEKYVYENRNEWYHLDTFPVVRVPVLVIVYHPGHLSIDTLLFHDCIAARVIGVIGFLIRKEADILVLVLVARAKDD
jgi:hypothetical protein